MAWGRSRGRSRYNQWPQYVSVAEQRAQSEREIKKLQKKGQEVNPVTIEGRTIARSFWGKGWCTHLESFGDYENRLPRGRRYVRNGSVCHLGISKGVVDARVAGSRLYKVEVTIAELKPAAWKALKSICTGKIGSLIELLQGRLSDEIMRAVTDPEHGLFPKPGEIKYTCNCPDWADMCKHIAAVMYGIGARLDEQPELLFRLRGVDHEELLDADAATGVITGEGSRRSRRRRLADDELTSVFGVDLETDASLTADKPIAKVLNGDAKPAKKRSSQRAKTRTNGTKRANKMKASVQQSVFEPSGASIRKLRADCGLTKAAFARAVGVTSVTVANWEKAQSSVTLHDKSRAGLQRLHQQRNRNDT